MRRPRARRWSNTGIVLGLVLGLVVAACGDDDAPEVVGSDTVAPGSAAAPTDPPESGVPPVPTSTTTIPPTTIPVTDASTSTTSVPDTTPVTPPPTPPPTGPPSTAAPPAVEPLGYTDDCGVAPTCGSVALAEDGALVWYDPATATLTFDRAEDLVVTLVPSAAENILWLTEVGPDDVAYFVSQQPEVSDPVGYVKAVSTHPDNAGETVAISADIDLSGDSDLFGTPAGLVSVGCCGGERRPALDAPMVMHWVDHSGVVVASSRPDVWIEYGSDGTATFHVATGAGSASWTAANAFTRSMPAIAAIDDGGLIVDLSDPYVPDLPSRVLRFSPEAPPQEVAIPAFAVLVIEPSGALIAVVDGEYVRLRPWTCAGSGCQPTRA